MADDTDGGVATGPVVGASVVAFVAVTLVAGTLLGTNWTQAVLVGGFAGVVAALTSWVTGRRAGDR